MPIAPGSPLNYVTFSAPSAVDAMTQVVSIMSGWGWIQQETLANGCRLRGSSPQQGVACWLDCSVTADPDLLSIQFASRSGASDVLHRIAHVAGSIYQVHVGPCQIFLAIADQRASISGTTLCGGIPYITPEAGLDLADVSEVWWAMGDAPAMGFSTISRSPRSCLGEGINAAAGSVALANDTAVAQGTACEARWNGDYYRPAERDSSLPVILIPTLTSRIGESAAIVSPYRTWDGSAAVTVPLLKIGGVLRGQLWDSLVVTESRPAGQTNVFKGYPYVNWTDRYPYGSLYLLQSAGANYVSS